MNKEIIKILRNCEKALNEASGYNDTTSRIINCITNLEQKNERLLHIAKKMHTYIFLNSSDEQKVYDELGLTDEENKMLGYSGKIILTGGDDNGDNR